MRTDEQMRAIELLESAELFFGTDDDCPAMAQTLNMSDTWAWGCSDGEYVPDEELPRVAELFERYGFCGVLYWVSERNNKIRSEFADINRFIEFARNEESIRAEIPDSSTRAYAQLVYTIGSIHET